MSRRWTIPYEWAWLPSLLLAASFFVPKETLVGHAAQLIIQEVALVSMIFTVGSPFPAFVRPWLMAVMGILATLVLYFGASSVYYHWRGDQVRQQSSVN